MPRKVREVIRDLQRAGFVDRGGRGSHRNFTHEIYRRDGRPLPKPMSGRQFVTAMQSVA